MKAIRAIKTITKMQIIAILFRLSLRSASLMKDTLSRIRRCWSFSSSLAGSNRLGSS